VFRYRDEEIAGSLATMVDGFAEGRRLEDWARSFTAEKRRELAKEGKALPDGSYPIETKGDLSNALSLARSGHGNVGAAMAHIKRRATALGVKLDSKEKSDADVALDRSILAAINRAISLQETDNDSPMDAKVLAALRQAKVAQEADMKEG
jgi:hypothetical protein